MPLSDSSKIEDIKDFTFPLGTCAGYLYNVVETKYDKMDDTIERITGMSANRFLNRPINEHLIQMLDMSHSEAISQFIVATIEKFKRKEINSTDIINMIYSIRAADGKRKRIMDQFRIIHPEKSPDIHTKGMITDISHFGAEGMPTFHVLRNNKIIFQFSPTPQEIIKESSLPLSTAEFQLLQLIASGNFSKDIAKQLKISIKTFYTHRRNIREKMEMDINSVIAVLREKRYLP